jgi:hypothetical protein
MPRRGNQVRRTKGVRRRERLAAMRRGRRHRNVNP